MSRHADEFPLSRMGAASIRQAEEEGYFTDAIVNSDTTESGLLANVSGGHADQIPNQHRILRGIGFVGSDGLAEVDDTLVNASTTVDELTVPTAGANDSDRLQAIE